MLHLLPGTDKEVNVVKVGSKGRVHEVVALDLSHGPRVVQHAEEGGLPLVNAPLVGEEQRRSITG